MNGSTESYKENSFKTESSNEIMNNEEKYSTNQQDSELSSTLPSWDLLPPCLVIKRVKRSI